MVALRENDGLTQSFPAVADSIPRARHAVAEFAARAAEFGHGGLDAVRTAVSEAVTNAVVHAYRDGETGQVRVSAARADGELWVLVADDGCGYRTPAVHPGLGCGLAVIAALASEYSVLERAEGGTEVRMRFSAAAPEAS